MTTLKTPAWEATMTRVKVFFLISFVKVPSLQPYPVKEKEKVLQPRTLALASQLLATHQLEWSSRKQISLPGLSILLPKMFSFSFLVDNSYVRHGPREWAVAVVARECPCHCGAEVHSRTSAPSGGGGCDGLAGWRVPRPC